MTYHCWFNLDHLTEVVFFRFLYCKISLLPPTFSCCTLWKKVQPTMHNPHLRIGELYSTTSLSAEYPCKLFGNFLHGTFVSSIYLFSDISMDSLILWVTIQYYIILLLKLFQLWPLGTLSVVTCVSLIKLHHCCFKALPYFLAQGSSCIFPVSPRISHFSRRPGCIY